MNNFYSNIEVRDGKYIGIVYNSSNNTKIYESKEYSSQSQAIQDINLFLSDSANENINTVITNTLKYKDVITNTHKQASKRCCGR